MTASERIVETARAYGWVLIDRPEISTQTFKRVDQFAGQDLVMVVIYDRRGYVNWCECRFGADVKRIKGGTEAVISHLRIYRKK